MFIDKLLLIEARACFSGQEKFYDLFPNGVEVTEDLCVKHAGEFDFQWAGDALLHGYAWEQFRDGERELWDVKLAALEKAWHIVDIEEYSTTVVPVKRAYDVGIAKLFAKCAGMMD